MKNKKIIIGSRRSKLALIYAERAKSEIMKFAQISGIEEVEIKSITTTGDTIQNTRLSDYGGKGLFSVSIEAAVSSQLDSIPKIIGFLFIKLVFVNNTI